MKTLENIVNAYVYELKHVKAPRESISIIGGFDISLKQRAIELAHNRGYSMEVYKTKTPKRLIVSDDEVLEFASSATIVATKKELIPYKEEFIDIPADKFIISSDLIGGKLEPIIRLTVCDFRLSDRDDILEEVIFTERLVRNAPVISYHRTRVEFLMASHDDKYDKIKYSAEDNRLKVSYYKAAEIAVEL